MSISLQKGQKVSLTKENSSLNLLMIGLGWDQIKPVKKGLFSPKPTEIDCDASVIMLQAGKFQNMQELVYFGNLKHKSGAVQHLGDNQTGAGDGDDEQILVELNKVPASYDRLVFVVNVYNAIQKRQHFGMIENAFIRLVNGATNQEMCRFDLKDNYNGMLAMIFGEVYRHDGEWKFNPIGEATMDPGLKELVQRYV